MFPLFRPRSPSPSLPDAKQNLVFKLGEGETLYLASSSDKPAAQLGAMLLDHHKKLQAFPKTQPAPLEAKHRKSIDGALAFNGKNGIEIIKAKLQAAGLTNEERRNFVIALLPYKNGAGWFRLASSIAKVVFTKKAPLTIEVNHNETTEITQITIIAKHKKHGSVAATLTVFPNRDVQQEVHVTLNAGCPTLEAIRSQLPLFEFRVGPELLSDEAKACYPKESKMTIGAQIVSVYYDQFLKLAKAASTRPLFFNVKDQNEIARGDSYQIFDDLPLPITLTAIIEGFKKRGLKDLDQCRFIVFLLHQLKGSWPYYIAVPMSALSGLDSDGSTLIPAPTSRKISATYNPKTAITTITVAMLISSVNESDGKESSIIGFVEGKLEIDRDKKLTQHLCLHVKSDHPVTKLISSNPSEKGFKKVAENIFELDFTPLLLRDLKDRCDHVVDAVTKNSAEFLQKVKDWQHPPFDDKDEVEIKRPNGSYRVFPDLKDPITTQSIDEGLEKRGLRKQEQRNFIIDLLLQTRIGWHFCAGETIASLNYLLPKDSLLSYVSGGGKPKEIKVECKDTPVRTIISLTHPLVTKNIENVATQVGNVCAKLIVHEDGKLEQVVELELAIDHPLATILRNLPAGHPITHHLQPVADAKSEVNLAKFVFNPSPAPNRDKKAAKAEFSLPPSAAAAATDSKLSAATTSPTAVRHVR